MSGSGFEAYGTRWIIRSPHKRANGVYHTTIRDRATGRVRKISSGQRNLAKARTFFRAWCENFESSARGARTPRFDVACEEYLSLRLVAASTLEDERRSFEGLYRPWFGESLLSEIGRREVDRFLVDLKARQRAPRTVQKHVQALRAFFRWAIERGYAVDDPTAGIKVRRAKPKVGRALSVDEARRLVRACGETAVLTVRDSRRASGYERRSIVRGHLLVAVMLAIYTGLRQRNVLGLRWSQVDIARREILIPADEMKSGQDHTIPIHPTLARLLLELQTNLGRISPAEFVIGENVRSVKRSFETALRRADCPRIRWHDLRHTFGTWMATRTTEAILKRLMAHAPSASDITWHYVHVAWTDLCGAVDALPDLTLEREPADGALFSQARENNGA